MRKEREVMERKCAKCGTDLPGNVKFCPVCGTPAPVEEQRENKAGNVKIPKKMTGIIAVVAVLVIVVGIFLATRPKVINLEDYLEYSVDGYDGYGTAHAVLNRDKLVRDIMDIAQKKKKNTIIDEDRLFQGVELYVDATPTEGLSNGDEVEIIYTYNADDLKNYGIKLKAKNKTITVEGLEEVKEVDIFKDLKLEFTGRAPEVRTNEYVHIEVDGAVFDCLVSPYENLDIGDEVTVECTDSLPVNGYMPKSMKATIKVPDTVEHYVNDPTELTEEDKTYLSEIVRKVFEKKNPYQYTISRVDFGYGENCENHVPLTFCSLSEPVIINDMHYYVYSNAAGQNTRNMAVIYCELDATVADDYDSYSEASGQTYHIFGYFCLNQLIRESDGKLTLEDESDVDCRAFYVDEAKCKENFTNYYMKDWYEQQEYIVALDGSKEVEKVQ